MDTTRPADTAATVILGQRIRPGQEQAFEAWQMDMNREASKYPGFIGAEINPPTAVQREWVIVYRFDSIAHVQAWLNSSARQQRLVDAERYFDGPGTQQVVGGRARQVDPLVTVVVTHRVDETHIDEFLDWQNRLRLAESKFEGFRGSELFRPVEGIQEEWTALYRYETAEDLDRWLLSDERRELLIEGEKFSEYHSRTIDNSFGSWFAFDDHHADTPPSELKTSIAVWVGLYPTVVILTLALAPLRMPLWLGLLVGNLLSSLLMSFVTMPFYVNPLLKSWMVPARNAPAARTNRRGIAIAAVALSMWTVVFYLVTRVFWHLP